MILCPRFTFIHIPKNAGSFVETVLKKTYRTAPRALTPVAEAWDRMVTVRILNKKPYCYYSVGWQMAMKGFAEILVHGFASETPVSRMRHPFLAVMRDPLDRSISEFEFRWWEWSGARHPNEERIRRSYPDWPSIRSFSDYVFLRDEFHTLFQEPLPAARRVGIQTETFIRFFCRNPRELLAGGADSLSVSRVVGDLFDVHFLNMDFVNAELGAYLRAQGVAEHLAAAAEGHERVLPDNRGRSEHKNYAAYYNNETLEHVAKKEAIVLAIWKLIAEGYRTTADLRLKLGL